MFSILESRLAALRVRLGEPHRVYHRQSHVDAMLRGMQDLPGPLLHPAAMELAIWYHDAVHDPAARDNEERSAALLRADLTGLVHPQVLGVAMEMIRLTATHTLPPDLPDNWREDVALFLDLDLSILGAPPDAYDAYEQGIVAEFEPVHGRKAYQNGRAAFLRDMLARPRLFNTAHFHDMLEAAARANLRRALERIGIAESSAGT
jgi:predicted metal-dependent HD superfamily phosphohydrolase